MPRPESSDETCEHFVLADAQFTTDDGAANVRPKLFRVNAVRINDYLLIRDSIAQQIAPLDFRDDEDTCGRVQVQTLESLQQGNHSRHVPVFSDPHLRAVVFQKQRRAGAQTTLNAGPGEPPVPLINQIYRRTLDLSRRARGKD